MTNSVNNTETMRIGTDYYNRNLKQVSTIEECAQEFVDWINDGFRRSGDGWGMSSQAKNALKYYFIRATEIANG